ncbi:MULTISPECIES: hypothetical protein [unclassified Mesorhizobium]|uniref:DUF6894 family protein n=1 Tax=unclassified Mesorhizobium TaxID=325217 RepID=UPI000F74D41A|nr:MULTISPECIES: hypothetical protein [unclassified Mesorhizobium]AZO58957.1 hypothetical protein EJ078_06295 [Mesorhizobium sp. M1A.F.Ca.IN.022.06.1.1]MCT2579100.1 hypothetical protein [Mesorhizobium sp. P13.3]MDF3168039.1 hypothetical protein [Mesorhizobium sp. P16.1]MDF3180053.1 hypothetical protein [Mesorhizobium sp. P17.1]MDF3184953.1 hypothetical protein [Mesorhizobium sp. ICCV3110.1]
MSRYFFDTFNGSAHVTDETGAELDDMQAVRREASTALAEMAAEVVPIEDRLELFVDVRDEAGAPVLKARAIFEMFE